MAYTVGDVAALARISVRTLHHYDAIGLVRPSGRSAAGYRLYTDRDLERLQQVLLHRELGMRLEDIARALDDPAFDRRRALLAQRAAVAQQLERATTLLATIDRTLRSLDHEGDQGMTKEQMFEGFDPAKYEDEVKERWGNTEAYRQSKERTGKYTKDDWARIQAEAGEITTAFAQAMAAGVAPGDDQARALAERHRLHIDRWFYTCSHQMHVCLGDMYVADPRFTETYDRTRPGLAAYIRDAIRANAGQAVPGTSE